MSRTTLSVVPVSGSLTRRQPVSRYWCSDRSWRYWQPRPTFEPTETLPRAIRDWADREPGPARSSATSRAGHAPTGSSTRRALRWADAFRRAGIEPGDNVPTMVRTRRSRPEEHWLGLAWLRAVQTGVNTDFRGRMLDYVLTNCQATAA